MPLQNIQLDDRSFEQLFAETVARIPVHTPEWTNFNDSDPGITIVQLFAFMTENLLYRSNRIPEANRRKFLMLLGMGLQPATPGRGLVTFLNDRGPVRAWPVEAGQELRAGKVPLRTRTGVCILPVTAMPFYKKPQTDLDAATQQQYQLLYQTFIESSSDQLQFYQTKQLDAPETGKPLPFVDLADSVNYTIDRSLWVALVGPQNVPVSSVRAAIAGQTLTIGIYPAPECPGMVLHPLTAADNKPAADPGLVFEIASPDPDPTDPEVGTGPARYTRLTVDYAENVLEAPGVVQVELPAYEKLLLWDFDPEEEGTGDYPPLIEDQDLQKRIATWIRIRLPKPQDQSTSGVTANPQQQAQLTWVGVNAARVVQSLLVEHELLGVGTGAPDQSYKVANTPVIVETTQDTSPTAVPSSTFVLEVQNTDGLWEQWLPIDDLTAARPTDLVYQLDPESGAVTFGNGLNGLRPPVGRKIRVSYEFGGGLAGQVGIGAINKCAALPGGFKVQNPVITWGASAGDDVATGERNISRYLRNRDRLVTLNDFRDITLRTPAVDMGRVEVLPLFNPDRFDSTNPTQTWPGTVTVLVIPKSDPVQPDAPLPDRLFLNAVCEWLDPRRLVTTELYVRGPSYVPLWVSVGIVTMPGQMREIVQRNVQAAIREYLSPLVGGPPVVVQSSLESDCPTDSTVNSDPCPTPRGAGWPLSTPVQVQDLVATVTRVAGVRYVDSLKLGIVPSGGAAVSDVVSVPMAGLQLPRLAGISVREGPAEDLAVLLGRQPTLVAPNLRPVPVLPKKC